MRESPRTRRLRSDYKAIEKLRNESSILSFTAHGMPAESYVLRFHGKGVWRVEGTNEVLIREHHEVTLNLGASYPRMIPEMAWRSPIYHPNISASGVVCLGGYGTHWVPAVQLDELCTMLWEMIRYQNFDVESPYNREAAIWAKTQSQFTLPLDRRPLRDVTAGMNAAGIRPEKENGGPSTVMFLDSGGGEEIIDAEIVDDGGDDILFIG